MYIKYQDIKTKNLLENKNKFVQKFKSQELWRKFTKVKQHIINSDNLRSCGLNMPGLKIERKQSTRQTWKLWLNKKWRTEFLTDTNDNVKVLTITITKIHPHKY